MKSNKPDARLLPPQVQEDLRRRVVAAVVDRKCRIGEAARTFGVSRMSIYNWLEAVEAGGRSALRARKRGPKGGSRLAGHEAGSVVRIIEDRCPDQLRLPFALWTRQAVAALIQQRYGMALSVWTVGRYLRRWGFTPQKPVRRAYERDSEAVRQWLVKEYPAIRRCAKTQGAEIYWGDQMGLRSDHQSGTSYGRRGRTPVIPGTGKRFGCSMMSAITNRGHLAFMVFKCRFTAKVMLIFLRRLVRQVGRKTFLIVDGHPVHGAQAVRRWLAAHAKEIRMFFLPGYSPDLNPDELLNNDVKTNALGRRRPADQTEMIDTVRSYLRGTQHRPDIVINYFQEEHVHYAADSGMYNEYCPR
jgi:transposase